MMNHRFATTLRIRAAKMKSYAFFIQIVLIPIILLPDYYLVRTLLTILILPVYGLLFHKSGKLEEEALHQEYTYPSFSYSYFQQELIQDS